jgi:hypothetical protein
MAIGPEHSGNFQLNELLQAVTDQLRDQLPGGAAIQQRRQNPPWARFDWLRQDSNQGHGPVHPLQCQPLSRLSELRPQPRRSGG